MTTYISMLRGINVSGQRLIKMDALRKMYEYLGLQNITTYLQSGNVVFTGDDIDVDELEQRISRQIEKDFRFEVPVIVLTMSMLKQVIDNNPLQNNQNIDTAFLYVTFLNSLPHHSDHKLIEAKKQNGEEISLSDNAVYLYCPNGYGRTKLTNNFLESRLKVGATTRNWKTTTELFKIAQIIVPQR